ncbi:hypothetical protein AVEN_143037-1 [Araneus ventricosus]|uniref:MATH domain-containing protein n=1 Tax=Araneus ventricosus TaxID=182803 RepID=A0A4Y2KST1_ARAVE|nr:hypothetical protein AVEN_143037-1 [Araneus ventricosus]
MFVRRGEKHELTWIMQITNLSELSSRCLSPRFQTTGNVEWKIMLWTCLYSGEDYLFCTLLRMLDGGPSEVYYSVYCKVFNGCGRNVDHHCPAATDNISQWNYNRLKAYDLIFGRDPLQWMPLNF